MAVQEIIPSSNVLMIDIRDTLNANGGSVGNELTTFFTDDAGINQWSFRKPYSSTADMFKLTDSQIRAINCGFTMKSLTSYSQVPSNMDGEMNGWVYTKPKGGSSSPYRLGDFVGYYPKALPMIQNFYVPNRASNQFENASVNATAIVSQQDGKSVSLADLGTLINGYASVYIKQASGTQSRMYKASNTLSSGTFDVEVPVDDLTSGEWEVYPFITLGSAYYTIPNVQSRTITIVTSNFAIAVLAERVTTGTMAISYRITITNTSTAVTWTNNAYKLKFFSSKYEEATKDGETSGTLKETIQVAANGETTINGFLNVSTKLWNEAAFTLWVSFNNGAHIENTVISSNTQE